MEKIKDASYNIMMNKELRYEFLEVYKEFPSLYDKHAKKFKNNYPKRLYTSNGLDFYKIAGVFCEAEKNKELMERIGHIFLTYLRLRTIDNLIKQGKKFVENGKVYDLTDPRDQWYSMVDYLESEIYYEFHFLYVYFKERSNIFEELDEGDPMNVFIKRLKPRSFKQISGDYNRSIRTGVSKMKFTDNWDEILQCAKECFINPREDEEIWSSFIREINTPEDIEKVYSIEMQGSPKNDPKEIKFSIDNLPDSMIEYLGPAFKPRGFTINLAFTYELILEMCRFIKNGIDIPMIMLRNPLKEKEIRDIVYAVRHNRSVRGEEEPSTQQEWLSCVHEVCILCIEESLVKNYLSAIEASYREEKNETDTGQKTLEKTLLKLKEENERLNKIVAEKEKKYKQIIKNQKNDIKELHSQVYELKKTIESLEPDEMEDAVQEIHKICEEIEMTNPELEEYGEEDFIKFVNKYKILIWGVRDKTQRKYTELYPELNFADTDRELTYQQVSKYDAVIINTSYTSHSKYYCARDVIKSAKKPFAVLASGANNQSQLWKAGKELEEKLNKLE